MTDKDDWSEYIPDIEFPTIVKREEINELVDWLNALAKEWGIEKI